MWDLSSYGHLKTAAIVEYRCVKNEKKAEI